MKFPALFALVLFAASTAYSQTTTWRAADNPHVVQDNYTVPAGETLIMEPGVQVLVKADSTFQINGQLLGNGTAANPIVINGGNNYSAEIDVRGTMDLKFTNVKTKTVPDDNGVLLFADCTFSGNGTIFNGQIVQGEATRAPYLQFDRCAFQGDGTYSSASLYVAYCTAVVRNTTFSNASYCSVSPGYLFVDHVTSTGSTQFGLDFGSDSDLFIDNVRVTGATRAGLVLSGDTRNGTNVLIGPNVTLQDNEFPVHLTIAGLDPGSAIPATGNRNNMIQANEIAGAGGVWPKFAIPYYVDGAPLTVGALLHIEPGVVVKMAPYSYINDVGFADGVRAYGTKNDPIVFQRADPTQAWSFLHADRDEGGRMRHVIVEGSSDGVNGGEWRLENCIFRNNAIGTEGGAIVSGSQYLNNGTGHFTAGNVNGGTNPNSFEGNNVGVNSSDDARNVWWGSPSGPTSSRNPGGTGDSLESQFTEFNPFLRGRPDYSDAPPDVRLMKPAGQQNPGSKVTLRWDATDDVGIVSQKVLFSAVGNFNGSFVEVATLPGDQRSYEWTVPDIGFQNPGPNAFIKVVATDTTGKESFDEWEIIIPTNTIQGNVTFNITPGQTFESGEIPAPLYTANIEPYMTQTVGNIEIIGRETTRITARGMPFLSTDSARYVVAYGDTSNRQKFWYSPIFKIRPKSLVGDAPPVVGLTSPQAGASFAPDSTIPLTWTASDDEGLRGFDIVASYDGARTWNPIVRNLPGAARSYQWKTAPGTGYADVRVMVIAKDWRFQTSSDGADRVFSTTSGVISRAVESLTLAPKQIATGETSTGTVTLAAPAPDGGTLVTISSDGQVFLTMPANITIPAGSTTGTFSITNPPNYVVAGTFQISASSAGVTKTAPLVVTLKLTDLELPPQIASGATVSGSVALSGPAPAGGAIVKLTSADTTAASVPAQITVPEGAQNASFTAKAGSVAQPKSVSVTGRHAGTTRSITVMVGGAATPTPTPTATPSPTATATPTPSVTPTPTASPSPAPVAPVASNFTIVADSTNPAFSGFGAYPSLNNSGTVAFYAEKPPGSGSVYTATDGSTPVLVSAGGNGAPSINEHGTVVSSRDIEGGTATELYKHTPEGVFQQVARTGNEYRSFPDFAYLGDNGTVVFVANRNPASPTRYGLYTGKGDGTTTALAENLGEFATFGGEPTINAAGTVAFTGGKDNLESGLYIAKGGTSAGITTVLTQDGSPVRKFDGAPFINDNDQIAFKAYEDSSSEPGIFYANADGSGLTTFARAGGQGPDGPYSQFKSPVINNVGTIVFYANLDTGGRGIFAGPKPVADKVIVVGDSLFGSKVSNLGFLRGLNDWNEIAFYYALEDGRSGIAKAKLKPRVTAPQRGPIPASYHLTEIPPLPGQQLSRAAAINQKGQIAANTEQLAFRGTAGVSQPLNALPGGDLTRAFAINNKGQVAGDSNYTNSGNIRHATLWSTGTVKDLGTLPNWGNYSRALGINFAGQVVGTSGPKFDGNSTHAFIWGPAKGMRDIGTLGGGYARALAINDSAVVTGDSQLATGFGPPSHAFTWTAAGGIRDLGTIAGDTSIGTAINAKGKVVGYSTINAADNRQHAFLYDGTKMHDLGSLGGTNFYSDRSFAYGINNNDQVVGGTYRKYNGGALQGIPFIYGNGKMWNLQALVDASGAGYTLGAAVAINDAGEIVVEADGPNGVRGVLLTPNSPAAAIARQASE